jgi:hypothetical protein
VAWRGIENLLMNVRFGVCYFKDQKAAWCHKQTFRIRIVVFSPISRFEGGRMFGQEMVRNGLHNYYEFIRLQFHYTAESETGDQLIPRSSTADNASKKDWLICRQLRLRSDTIATLLAA